MKPIQEKKSKFEEYAELTGRAVANYDKVIAGNWNKALKAFDLLDENKKKIAEERLVICEACPFNSKNAKTSKEYSDLYMKGIENITQREYPFPEARYGSHRKESDFHCAWCGCKLEEKTLAMDSDCGVEQYNRDFSMNEPLKWKAVK